MIISHSNTRLFETINQNNFNQYLQKLSKEIEIVEKKIIHRKERIKNMTLEELCKKIPTIATYVGFGGTEIKGIFDNKVIIFVTGTMYEKQFYNMSEVCFDEDRPYFIHCDWKIYLDECMRV